MIKMKRQDARRQSILHDLRNNDCCTYEYLMDQYDISERAMQMDIKELCKQGHKIKGVKAKKGYVLTQEAENAVEYYESSDLRKIRKLFLIQILQNSHNGHTKEELALLLEQYNCFGKEADEEEKKRDTTTVSRDLEDLIASKMVAVSKQDEKKYVIAANAPLQLAFSEEEAMELLNLLDTCSKGHHHEKILEKIRKKLMIALWYDHEEELYYPSSYVVYNKGFETAEKLEYYLQELNQYSFESKVLKITYINRMGETNTILFSVGNVVYSVDKDKLYLMGESADNYFIILYPTIKKIEVTELENRIFRNEFYLEIVKDMFAISLEEAEYVKVEFEDIFAIREKLSRLLVNRPNAKLYEKNHKLIYEDKISGLRDFAAYLRRYGAGCKVIEPPKLCKMMQESAARILQNYEALEKELNGQ